MKDLKDKATNVAGVMVLIGGIILSIVTGGVALPPVIVTIGAISGTTGAAIISFFSGKNANGSKKSRKQIDNQK